VCVLSYIVLVTHVCVCVCVTCALLYILLIEKHLSVCVCVCALSFVFFVKQLLCVGCVVHVRVPACADGGAFDTLLCWQSIVCVCGKERESR
jgi:hypothetical protein